MGVTTRQRAAERQQPLQQERSPDYLISSNAQYGEGRVVAVAFAFCVKPNNDITTGNFCSTGIRGSLVPRLMTAVVAHHLPVIRVLPPLMGIKVGTGFFFCPLKWNRLIYCFANTHTGECTEQHKECQVLSVTGTSRGRVADVPDTSIWKPSGAHDLRDGTFPTVAEDGQRKTRPLSGTGSSQLVHSAKSKTMTNIVMMTVIRWLPSLRNRTLATKDLHLRFLQDL